MVLIVQKNHYLSQKRRKTHAFRHRDIRRVVDFLCNIMYNTQHEKNIQVSAVSDPETGNPSEPATGRVSMALQPFS